MLPGNERGDGGMKRYKELTIFTPNKPGQLAKVLTAIARAKVNITAMDSSSGYDLNMVRLVTSNPAQTRKVLEKLGHTVSEATVLGFAVPDRPGELAQLTRCIGRAKVNIDYNYVTAPARGDEALMIFHVSDFEAAERAVRAAGLAGNTR